MKGSLPLLLIILSILGGQGVYAYPTEVCGYIDRVVDGDTVWIVVEEVDREFPGISVGDLIKVRLADINAPELGTPEGEEASDALYRLVSSLGWDACLDVDDEGVYDPYGRVVAILYLVSGEELINVNAYMVREGYAVYRDYPNEFGREDILGGDAPEIPEQGGGGDLTIYIFFLMAVAILLLARRRVLRARA